MKKLATLILAMSLSACTVLPYTAPGISESVVAKAKSKCKDHGGLKVVNISYVGYGAFCNDREMFIL